jgi:hypothetical protein
MVEHCDLLGASLGTEGGGGSSSDQSSVQLLQQRTGFRRGRQARRCWASCAAQKKGVAVVRAAGARHPTSPLHAGQQQQVSRHSKRMVSVHICSALLSVVLLQAALQCVAGAGCQTQRLPYSRCQRSAAELAVVSI